MNRGPVVNERRVRERQSLYFLFCSLLLQEIEDNSGISIKKAQLEFICKEPDVIYPAQA